MLPNDNDLFWKWKVIYEELLDPFTETVESKYFSSLLETQFKYCKKMDAPISIAILEMPNLPNSTNNILTLETYSLIKNITDKIRKILDSGHMIFYDGRQTFLFILPKENKENTKRLISNIEICIEQAGIFNMPLSVKAGYAEFPSDAKDSIELQECAQKALSTASQSINNRIIGYFTERRKNIRAPLKVETRYTAPNSFEHLTCSRNISETGIMLSGMSYLPQGIGIILIFSLPHTPAKINITAELIWNKIITNTGKINMGFCFTNINNSIKELIKNFVYNNPPPLTHL